MDKKLSYYIDNSNFTSTQVEKKIVKNVKLASSKQNNLVKIVNGEIVIDDGDMFINNHAEEDMEIVEDDKIVTSGTYGKKRCSGRWNKVETGYFYEALSLCGLEFTLISNLFEDKNRRACKLKYLSETKKNQKKIDEALKNSLPFDRTKYNKLKERISTGR
ncbi:Transcription factor TFIIIB component B'' [Nosema granulosis]|uniref:Transcription factor TFIIIB component B n=1 Tax=Nosema granulosis TaxID=83296 RepID=A0A9P6H0A3_9MICR|nr:Transcription factor TFIIIB component B'' [Nosema granulosis]